jgi:cell division protein ZapE
MAERPVSQVRISRMAMSISARYADLVAAGEIERDPAQEALSARLDRLNARLETHRLARKSSSLGWFFGTREQAEPPLKGLYIHGDVGRGKTMLMDLFFAASAVRRKRRAHFHEFIADVHERVHAYRQEIKAGTLANGDPIARVAGDIAEESWLLCFDEFHVTDIADAMILGRLFTALFARGVIVVATSNVDPDELYKDGLNRALFVPFIALLRQRMDVVRLAAREDFRLQKLTSVRVWHVPADADADRALDAAWRRLTLGDEGSPLELNVKGHVLHVPRAAHRVARFTFAELCERPLGAIDYLRLAHEFQALVLDHVPVMDFPQRNEAKRFIALIDTLYDNAVKLVASAAAEPMELYRASEGYEVLEFHRTASRLIEMGSQDYLALPHGGRAAVSGSTEGIVET